MTSAINRNNRSIQMKQKKQRLIFHLAKALKSLKQNKLNLISKGRQTQVLSKLQALIANKD
ncbi:MAG: hypothetical protein IPI39_02530 [Candidatus Obscuribacter sp.]|nr:hypothetical protein [Candidatus Obscuribacter sp.]